MKKRKLYICNREWLVTFARGQVSADGKLVHGVTDRQSYEIHVAGGSYCSDHTKATLLHEFLHAVLSVVVNNYPDDEEPCVQALETGIYDALKDKRNGWFWDYMLGNEL